jgi:hypothetical protein
LLNQQFLIAFVAFGFPHLFDIFQFVFPNFEVSIWTMRTLKVLFWVFLNLSLFAELSFTMIKSGLNNHQVFFTIFLNKLNIFIQHLLVFPIFK